jgi:hypothetical protein
MSIGLTSRAEPAMHPRVFRRRRSRLVALVACLQLTLGLAFAPPAASMPASSLAHMAAHHHGAASGSHGGQQSNDPCHAECCDHCAAYAACIVVPVTAVAFVTPASAPRVRQTLANDEPLRDRPTRRLLPPPLGPPVSRV